jgi:hypothetical protein
MLLPGKIGVSHTQDHNPRLRVRAKLIEQTSWLSDFSRSFLGGCTVAQSKCGHPTAVRELQRPAPPCLDRLDVFQWQIESLLAAETQLVRVEMRPAGERSASEPERAGRF